MSAGSTTPDFGLLAGQLRQYRDALTRHGRLLREERALLEPRLVALMDVFHGVAAQDFYERWIRSNSRLDEDEARIDRLLRQLDAKVSTLEEINRPSESGGG